MKNRLYKFLSILLSVLILFSVCIVPTVASADDEQTVEYYVKNPGYDNYGTVTDADGSKEKPFETVYDLVTYINANQSYGTGDTVNVYIMQQSNVKVFNSSTGIHNMTSWTDTAANAVATIPDHDYTLVLKSPEGQNNYLAFSHRLADNVDMMLSGPTEFDNVTVVNVRNSKDKAICFEGNDATFTEKCQYKYLQWAYYTASKTPPYEWGGSFQAVDMPLQMYRVTAEKTFSETTSINVNSSVGKLYIPSWRTNNYNVTYSEDVNITVDNALADLSFVWGINHRSTTTTFAKNLNINIKSATAITNVLGNATASNGVGAVNVGALQIIAPKGFAFDTSALTNLTISKTDDTENYWYIENGTGVKDILTFTETAGIFEVAQGYYGVTITDENNQKQNITDGKVTLPAGKYSVSIVEERTEFYVQNPGYDNYNTTTANGTKEKPFETVLDAVTYINSATDYDSEDAVTIYILQQSDIKAYNNTTGLHNMTSWTDLTADGVAAIPTHQYKLTLKSPDGENNYLTYSNKLADNVDMMFGGPTVFDNVTLVNVRNNPDKAICLEGYDAEFTENCDFKYLQHAYEPSSAKPQYDWNKTYYDAPTPIQMSRLSGVKEHSGSTITLNTNNAKLYLPTLRTNNYDCTYTDDVEIIVNNSAAEIEFVWGNANEAGIGTTTFKGNLTFDIKSAKKIVNTKANGPVVINGALQILVDSAASVSGDVAEFSNVSVDADRYWYVKNMLGNGAVSFTDTAGVYETTNTDAIAIDSNNVEHNQTNGEFTLPSGVYDINTKEIRLDTYYVKSPGFNNYNTVTDADGTKDKPFETVYDLVAYLNAKTTFGAGDTVNVCILQLDGVTDYNSSTGIHNMTSWTDTAASGVATVPSHEYTLSISSPENENNYLAYSNKLADNVDMMLSGPTVFDNVTLVNVRNNADKAVCLEGYDAEFTENCDFKYLQHAYEPSSAKPQYDWNKTYYDAPTPIQMSRLSGVKEHSGSTITLNTNNAKLYLPTLRTNNYDCTYTDDVEIIVNNSAAEIEFVWGNANEAGIGTTTFKGNLTFDIKSAKKIVNTKANGPVVINGALQILIEDDSKFLNEVNDFENVTVSQTDSKDNYWHLRNGTNVADALAFTETAGTYTVKSGMDIVALAEDGSEIAPKDNKLSLAAGNYIIKYRGVEYVDPLTIGKMIYFKNGSQDQYLSAWVSGTPGKTYIFTYSVFSTQDITPSLRSNGKRNSVNSADSGALGGEVCQLLNEQQHENYTTYTYKITIPQNYVDNYNESPQNYKVFLGFNMPLYAEGYLFDVACYEEGGDPNVSAWANGEFDNGFDGWIWGWLVTWFTSYGKGLTEWSDSYHEIRILDCDLSLIDALIADINRDDGVWWKPTDIIEYPEEIGYATFKGSYVDQNGEPLSNVKMILKSEDNTYTAYTDANGKFTFKNIVEGYYELYYVNSNGEEINTDFAYNFSGGDTVTINLVNDSSALTSELKGTVYTPQLEVVPNLKIYLRGFGQTVTDKDGNFSFSDVPIGDYELYTILENGTEYVFRKVSVKSGVDLAIKLKYDTESGTGVDLDGDGTVDVLYSDSHEGDLPSNSANGTDGAIGNLKGTVYTPQLKTVAGIKVYLRGVAETVTDKDGNFSFANVPVGEYELYTVLEDGSEYVFRTVSIKEGVDLAVKLKYDASAAGSGGALASYWIWIIIGCGAVVLIAAGVILFIILKKKKKNS